MLREWHLAPGYSEQGDRQEGCEMLMVTFAVTFPRDFFFFFFKWLKPQRWKRWRNISSFPINQNCDRGGTQPGGAPSSRSLGLGEEEEEEEEDRWPRCCLPWSWGSNPATERLQQLPMIFNEQWTNSKLESLINSLCVSVLSRLNCSLLCANAFGKL